MALVIAVLVILAIAVLAQAHAAIVAIIVVAVVVIAVAIVATIGKKQTGLSLTPEWKPEVDRDAFDEEDDEQARPADEADDAADNSSGGAEGQGAQAASQPDDQSDAEPIRRMDAQILGGDLSKLGQVVSPKLAKSYAVGTLVLEGPDVVWVPGAASKAIGIEELSAAPDQVSAVEAAPLWGSWALIRVATAGGDEWCMRVPGSVDLSPAFAELGLTVHSRT